MKIEKAIWFTTCDGNTLGIVMGTDEVTGERKAYIGVGEGIDETTDTLDIMRYGAKFTPDHIRALLNHFYGADKWQLKVTESPKPLEHGWPTQEQP
jgi:hypothetical protein